MSENPTQSARAAASTLGRTRYCTSIVEARASSGRVIAGDDTVGTFHEATSTSPRTPR